MVAPLARAVRNEITALNCRLALVVDPRIYRVGRNEKKKNEYTRKQRSTSDNFPMARADRNGIIACTNRLAVVVGLSI